MNRRKLITLAVSTMAAAPFDAEAKRAAKVYRIGFISGGRASRSGLSDSVRFADFLQGIKEAGYVEGQDFTVDWRFGEGRYERYTDFATEFVRLKMDVIVTLGGTPSALALKAATTTIPVVFLAGGDPVEFGLVASLDRPGGNLTGVTMYGNELVAKRLELAHVLVPMSSTVALLVNPRNPVSEQETRYAKDAAGALGRRLQVLGVSSDKDLVAAFGTLVQPATTALIVSSDALFSSQNDRLVALARRFSVPTIYPWREAAVAGGLMSYGPSFADGLRQVGIYTSRILKGARPSELPIQQPTKFPLVINLKTAKGLRLEVPPMLLARADEVIE